MFTFASVSLINEVSVITEEDNLVHNYFASLEWDKDNSMPIGHAHLTMPYDKQILDYWIKYAGVVIVHAKLVNNEKNEEKVKVMNSLPNSSLQSTTIEPLRLQNDYYNYSFIGKVAKVKQVGTVINLHLEDLGWKFLQKVPKKFRDTFVAGQKLGDAFQAMCEFMGVDFAYSIEDLDQYNFAADGYSIEKDGTVIEEVPSLFEEWSNVKDEDEDEEMANALNDVGNEFEGNIDRNRNQSNISRTTSNSAANIASALNSQVTNNDDNNINTNENTEEDTTEEDKIEKYQEEFDKKVKDLFIGNTLYDSNVADPILNYGSITIQPVAPTTTEMSTVGDTTSTGSTESTDSNSNNNSNNSSSSSRSSYSSRNDPTNTTQGKKGIWGKTSSGKQYLTKEYINTLSMAQAKQKYEYGKKHNIYTSDTMQKLWYRMMFGTKFY